MAEQKKNTFTASGVAALENVIPVPASIMELVMKDILTTNVIVDGLHIKAPFVLMVSNLLCKSCI